MQNAMMAISAPQISAILAYQAEYAPGLPTSVMTATAAPMIFAILLAELAPILL